MLVNQQNVQNIFRGLRVHYDAGYQAAAPAWMRIATATESSGSEEEYDFLSALPGMKELIGEIALKNLVAQGFTIKNREWEASVAVKRKDIERDKLGIYKPLSIDQGRAAAQHPDELMAELLVNGFSATKGKCYTGSAFFANAHVPPGTKASKSQFDNKMTEKLSPAGFQFARKLLRQRKNSEGRNLKLGSKLLLIVAPGNETVANEILKADHILQAKGDSFAAVSNVDKGTAESLILPELGSYDGGEDMWFLMDEGRAMKPLIFQTELAPEITTVTDPQDSHVVKFKEFLFAVYARYNAGYGMPEFIVGSDGSAPAL